MFNIQSVSDRGSSYENLYTKQINEALGNQPEYENKKAAEKKKVMEENAAFKRHIKLFGYLGFAMFLGVLGYFINLDPANAGPCAIALSVFLVVAAIVYVINR